MKYDAPNPLVTRLRKFSLFSFPCDGGPLGNQHPMICDEAAAEIERLERALTRMTELYMAAEPEDFL